jgi:hypothetical protein
MSFLSGYKTYIVAGVAVIAAWVGVWAGTVDVGAAWQATETAILGATIRNGIATSK